MTTRPRPPFPSQPFATVEVPTGFPAADRRVSKIDVAELPRFQITCSTPSPVRASPSCAPAWEGPLIRDHAEPAPAAWLAPAATAATAATATAAMEMGRTGGMEPPSRGRRDRPGGAGGSDDPVGWDFRLLDDSPHGLLAPREQAQDHLVLAHQDRAEVAHRLACTCQFGRVRPGARIERTQGRLVDAGPEAFGHEG